METTKYPRTYHLPFSEGLQNDDRLPSYFFMFAARNNERWYSWKEIEELSSILGIPHVPVLEIRRFESISDLQQAIHSI